MFPGWTAPFSNTFGYLIAKLMGLPELMKKILAEKTEGTEITRALESIKTDNSLFINELQTEARKQKNDADGNPIRPLQYERPKFDTVWKKLETDNIVKKFPELNNERGTMMDKLYYFVNMKYTISEYVWNLLTGFLVTSISYNYILNTGCAKSPKEMKKRYDKYEADQDKKNDDNAAESDSQPTYTQM